MPDEFDGFDDEQLDDQKQQEPSLDERIDDFDARASAYLQFALGPKAVKDIEDARQALEELAAGNGRYSGADARKLLDELNEIERNVEETRARQAEEARRSEYQSRKEQLREQVLEERQKAAEAEAKEREEAARRAEVESELRADGVSVEGNAMESALLQEFNAATEEYDLALKTGDRELAEEMNERLIGLSARLEKPRPVDIDPDEFLRRFQDA